MLIHIWHEFYCGRAALDGKATAAEPTADTVSAPVGNDSRVCCCLIIITLHGSVFIQRLRTFEGR